ncbi:hypothetical protein BJF78_04445 [Pseudonocardia sp. CNS-139]|nr:hypothetical protein BJF78_04445 [Pseudonocardia sp. CNS-139]
MITTPHRRRDEAGGGLPQASSAGTSEADTPCPNGCAPTVRTVTADQVDRAVAQLRERPGRSAVEQIQSVLRVFDLTVVSTPLIPDPR